MKNFMITLAWDGTDYSGWQRLPSRRTIQGAVEASLSRVLGGEIEVIGSGRTDTGVHAKGQVANFHSATALSENKILSELNRILPKDIACLSCVEADERFHARYASKSKTYLYRILASDIHDPFEYRYSWRIKKTSADKNMAETALAFVGTHDFSSFTNLKEKTKSFEHTIFWSTTERSGDMISVRFSGDGFLLNQVRIMAGAVALAGSGEFDPSEVKRLLPLKERSKAPPMAPACGLFLERVGY